MGFVDQDVTRPLKRAAVQCRWRREPRQRRRDSPSPIPPVRGLTVKARVKIHEESASR